jgi:hypothetical protein
MYLSVKLFFVVRFLLEMNEIKGKARPKPGGQISKEIQHHLGMEQAAVAIGGCKPAGENTNPAVETIAFQKSPILARATSVLRWLLTRRR